MDYLKFHKWNEKDKNTLSKSSIKFNIERTSILSTLFFFIFSYT